MMGALVDHLWQSTLFGAGIWLITLALRSNPAAVRHGLWMLASLKFLVPFAALYWLGAATGLPPPAQPEPALSQALQATSPVISPAVMFAAEPVSRPLLLPAMLMAWCAGSAWMALRWLRGWRAAASISRAARPAPPGTLPDVLVTDADIEPAVARVWRPVVLLPAALLGKLDRAQLESVLAHEREHIARHDNLKVHLHQLVVTLFWFHPLVWLIGRRLLEERERACDEAVLARGHDAGDYASGILAVCRHCASAHPAYAVGAMGGDLTRRVRSILGSAAPRALGFVKSFALSMGAFAIAAVPFAAGAMDDSARRHAALLRNAEMLLDAHVTVDVRTDGSGRPSLEAGSREILIRNGSLRELIGVAYDVPWYEVRGGSLLEEPRYDIRIRAPGTILDHEEFDPRALRGLVTRLLASRFNLEIHVNHRCQDPCGPRALQAIPRTP